MRVLCPMTQEEQKFAEEKHDTVIDFLRSKRLPINDFYDVVIFGYLSAVQQYFRSPPVGVAFKAMAFRAMKDAVLRESEYNSCVKRCEFVMSLESTGGYGMIPDPRQDTERQVEHKALLEQAASAATPKEAKIINLLLDGFVLREVAQLLKMPMAATVSYMEDFYCRARAAIDLKNGGFAYES